jgi:hypothetical protein
MTLKGVPALYSLSYVLWATHWGPTELIKTSISHFVLSVVDGTEIYEDSNNNTCDNITNYAALSKIRCKFGIFIQHLLIDYDVLDKESIGNIDYRRLAARMYPISNHRSVTAMPLPLARPWAVV